MGMLSYFRFTTGDRVKFIRINLFEAPKSREWLIDTHGRQDLLQKPPNKPDSSLMLNDILAAFQRDLLAMVFNGDELGRAKYNLVLAAGAKRPCSAESYMDRGRRENELRQILGLIGAYLDFGCVTLEQFGCMMNNCKLYGYLGGNSSWDALLEVSERGMEWLDALGMTSDKMVVHVALPSPPPPALTAEGETKDAASKKRARSESDAADVDEPAAKRAMLEPGKAKPVEAETKAKSGTEAAPEAKETKAGDAAESKAAADKEEEDEEEADFDEDEKFEREREPTAAEMKGPVRIHFEYQEDLFFFVEYTQNSRTVTLGTAAYTIAAEEDAKDMCNADAYNAHIDKNRAVGVHTLVWKRKNLRSEIETASRVMRAFFPGGWITSGIGKGGFGGW